MTVSNAPFLIIAGSYRCGSTALFEHMGAHPGVCASTTKETGFFLPFGNARLSRPAVELLRYERYFKVAPEDMTRVRLEATPSYMYFRQTAEWIRELLPNARLVLSLREPVSRLVSWFQTARVLRAIPEGMDFAEYVQRQLPADAIVDQSNFVYMAREHGRYSAYVRMLLDVFGRDRVLVTWHDDLSERPTELLRRIAHFAGLEPSFYVGGAVRRINPAKKLRNWKHHTRFQAAKAVILNLGARLPVLEAPLHRMLRWVEPRYYEFATLPADKVDVAPALRAQLTSFYKTDVAPLSALVQCEVPWARAYGEARGS